MELCISALFLFILRPVFAVPFERLILDQYQPKVLVKDFKEYSTAQEIDEYVDWLGQNYKELVRVETIGHSAEKRPILAVKISTDHPVGSTKPIVFVDAGIHAREWVAPAAALFILQQLTENHQKNKALIEAVDWIIIPLVNPDGYIFSMSEDRLWRKNRANTTEEGCAGVDLNRNFDVYFGGKGTSTDPCEEIYSGPAPFSEPESVAIRDIALRHKGQVRLYLTLHSYGQYFLYPWGYDDHLPKDWKKLEYLANKAERALASVYGTRYKVGSSGRLMGAAAGGSDDWMKRSAGVEYSYTVELPGGGIEGFDLPPVHIRPVVTELFPAIAVFATYIGSLNQTSSPSSLVNDS